MSTFVLPDLGEGLQEAEIVAWHVAEGDRVVADQPLVSVETEKAVVEVPAPQSGTVARLVAKVGERVRVGAPLVEFAEGAGSAPGNAPGGVVGELAEPAASPPPAGTPARLPAATPPIAAAPAVRALARERGVDLATLSGSGAGGAITREDVERAAAAHGEAPPEPLRGVRRTMAVAMARAHAEIVPATVWDDAEIDAWFSPNADVTVRLVRAVAAACAAEPALNAWYDGTRMARRLFARVDLGIAVDTAEGLVVPVLRDVAHRDGASLRRDLDRLKAAARSRSATLDALRGATISLSNFGMIAGRQAALVVVPPQVAILGAGRVARVAMPDGKAVRFGAMLPLSLTFDHRAVTGGEAARFLKAMIDDLQRAE